MYTSGRGAAAGVTPRATSPPSPMAKPMGMAGPPRASKVRHSGPAQDGVLRPSAPRELERRTSVVVKAAHQFVIEGKGEAYVFEDRQTSRSVGGASSRNWPMRGSLR
jgi:hypothetical protein